MKMLSDRLTTSALGAVTLLCLGVLAGTLPALFGERDVASNGVLARVADVVFFPFLLLMRLCPETDYWPDVKTAFLGLLGLAFTLAFWTGVIHGLRWLLGRRLRGAHAGT